MVHRLLNLPKTLKKNSSAFLFGARGVGKTRLARDFASHEKEHLYFDLLEFDTYSRYLKSPAQLGAEVERQISKSKENLFVVVDEIQKVPSLLDEIHRLIESYKNRVRFLLTGSSARKLKSGQANMLAGRALTLNLHPLTFAEYDAPLLETLRLGSLPGIILDNENPEGSLKSYVGTYLREEIQQEALVRQIDGFAMFLDIAAQYHGKIVNVSEIGRAAGLTPPTVKSYFDILEDTLLAWRLPGWNASRKKQLRLAPKIYLFDNGVANALSGDLRVELTERTRKFGDLFECRMIQEAFRLNDYWQADLRFSYWHTNTGLEVDLIVSRGVGQPLAAIEIKSSDKPSLKDLNGLLSFATDYPKVRRMCWSRTPRPYTMEGIDVLPWRDGLRALAEL